MKRYLFVAGLVCATLPFMDRWSPQAGLWCYRLSMWLNPGLAEATTVAAEMMAKNMAANAVVVRRQPNPNWQ